MSNQYDDSTAAISGDHVTFWESFLLLLICVPAIMLWLFALGDLSKRKDLTGMEKGLWTVAVVLLPFAGMLIYFLIRPEEPESLPRSWEPVAPAVGSANTRRAVAHLEKLADLNDAGILTEEGLASAKQKVLEGS